MVRGGMGDGLEIDGEGEGVHERTRREDAAKGEAWAVLVLGQVLVPKLLSLPSRSLANLASVFSERGALFSRVE